MNLRSLLELTALVSQHSPLVFERRQRLASEPLTRFWCASRVRSRLWVRRLAGLREEFSCGHDRRQREAWRRAEPILADVLAGELLSRVWAAIVTAADREAQAAWAEPLARSVLAQQQFARHKVLALLKEGSEIGEETLVRTDRLRRRTERWSDLLIGHLVRRYRFDDLAFDVERALDFGSEQLRDSWQPTGCSVWSLYLVALRTAFPAQALPGGRLGELRTELTQAMLASFGDDVFDDSGLLQSARFRRLATGECLFDEALPTVRPSREKRRY